MKTKASFKSHPIHQMLIPFPIAFLVGALVFDLLGIYLNNSSFWITGAYLSAAGILMGVIAAVPGFIDYLFSVPPKSSGKKRATTHMIVNLTAVTLFLISFLMRMPVENEPGISILLLEFFAIGFLTAGGWMGGTLVDRNFIGPEHRYAHAGRWSEISFKAEPGQTIRIAGADDLKVDQMKLIKVNDKRIVLGRSGDGYFAFDDACTHRGGSLADGVMICGTVQCLWHGSQFDVKTGSVKAGPAKSPITTYRIESTENDLFLFL